MNKVSYVSGAGNIPFDIPTYINDCNVALLTNPAAPGVFTIPMTGSYLINYSVNTQGSGQLITSLKRNGSIMAIAYASPVAVNSFWPSNGTYIGNLLQNDTINIQYEAKLAPGWTSLTLLGYSFIQVTYIGPYVGPYVPPPAPAPAFA